MTPMTPHPSTGPIPPDEFKKLADAPFGAALKTIRKFDPLYGLPPGEKIKWRVTFEREITQEGEAYVMAASKEEAEKLADEIPESKICWDDDLDGQSNISDFTVEPARVP